MILIGILKDIKTASDHNIPPKIARHEPIPNIIEPAENEKFLSDIEQQEHTDILNTQAGLGLSQIPSTPPPPSSPPPVNNVDPRQQEFERFFHTEQPWGDDNELRDMYFRNFNLIRDIDQVHRRSHIYNRYLNGEETTLNEAMEHTIEQVYRCQNHSFKINLSFSAIFQNRETQEYKFYYASNNTKLLDKPKLIQNQDDLNNLLNFPAAKDFLTHLRNQWPNTKWVLERIDANADQLDKTSLPSYETFYSTIKGCNVLQEDYTTFQKLVDQGKSEQEALQILRLQEIPKTGPENYQWLQQLWTENEWSTFADFLKWYNDLDVDPMITAIEKMNDYYKDKNVDFMHQAITLPGIAKRI